MCKFQLGRNGLYRFQDCLLAGFGSRMGGAVNRLWIPAVNVGFIIVCALELNHSVYSSGRPVPLPSRWGGAFPKYKSTSGSLRISGIVKQSPQLNAAVSSLGEAGFGRIAGIEGRSGVVWWEQNQ